jgi:lysophospholipase L1-like esterase
MNLTNVIRIAVCATFVAGASAASTVQERFTSFWVVGDSLSAYVGQPGGATTARASNGPLWSEQIVNDFRNAGQEADSYAVGGATAGLQRPNPFNPAAPFDLTSQVDRLLQETSRFGARPVVSIWIGGNDIGAFAQGLPVANSIASYSSALSRLVGAGVSEFLLFEVPNVGFTPLVQESRVPARPGCGQQGGCGAQFRLLRPRGRRIARHHRSDAHQHLRPDHDGVREPVVLRSRGHGALHLQWRAPGRLLANHVLGPLPPHVTDP